MSERTYLDWNATAPLRAEAQRAKSGRFEALFTESAGAVLEEVGRLKRIVDEFSRFARLPKPEIQPLDLGELASSVLALYGAMPDGFELKQEIQRGIRVEADRDQLTQVLLNIEPSQAITPWCCGTSRARKGGKMSGRWTWCEPWKYLSVS